jgi:hypothetical protein
VNKISLSADYFCKETNGDVENTLQLETAYYKSNSISVPLINVPIIPALHVLEMKEPRLKTSSPQTTGHCEGF